MVLEISIGHHVSKHSNEWKYSLGIRNQDPMFIRGYAIATLGNSNQSIYMHLEKQYGTSIASVDHTVAHITFSAK